MIMSKKTKPAVLYYDIETKPLQAWLWSPGKQFVNHKQLVKQHSRYGIICVTYCWNDDRPAQCIDWGYEEQDTARVVREFDKVIRQADHIIGKNNKRFDDKMINAARMLEGLPPMPSWASTNDDLEQQMRRFFRLPSQSLDYISNQLGLGGKIKMEMQDWIDIVEKNSNGEKALAKMIKYGKKDVVDTRSLWYRLEKYIEPKFNEHLGGCEDCGSFNRKKSGFAYSAAGKRQRYTCKDCGHRIAVKI